MAQRGRPPKNKTVENKSEFLTMLEQLKIEKVISLNSKSMADDDVIFISVTPPVSPAIEAKFKKYHTKGYFGKATVIFVDNDTDLTLLKRSEIQ